MIIPTCTSSSSLLGDGPTLRVAGPAIAINSSSVPTYKSMTIPTQAQVGDFLIIACSNVVQMHPTYARGNTWRSIYSSAGLGTYNEYTTVFIKHCQSQDIGDTVRLYVSSNFAFQAIMNVFTNPQKTDIALVNGTEHFLATADLTSKSTTSSTNQTSLTVGTVQSNELPPNYLRFTSCAANGSSGYPNLGYSGSGVTRVSADTYWWRSVRTVYETNNTDTTNVGTFTCNSSSIAALSIYLI